MELVEQNHCFLIKDFFSTAITAGFTKPSVSGVLPLDLQKILPQVGRDTSFAYMEQKHSGRVFLIKKPGFYEADGLFTSKNKLCLLVKTADCLPILLAKKNRWMGVIHLGWRPAKEDILKNIPFDNLSDFQAVAGVGLRNCCYRVGDEFKQYFRFFLKKTAKGLFFDPIAFARAELSKKGLKKENFLDLNLCSFCSKNLFFSWRRDKTAWRTLSFIKITAN